jgi:hypothetical protein
MATTAAVVAAGATAAAAGTQAAAASKGKHGGHAPSIPDTPLWEKIFNRSTADVLDEERRVVEDALAQANFMQPELYRALGYEPIYDTQQGADVAALSQKFETLQNQFNDGRARILAIKDDIAAVRADNTLRPKEKRQKIQALKKERQQLKKASPNLLKEMNIAQRQLGDAQTVPRRIVGFKKLDQAPDPTQSQDDLFRVAFDLQNQTLVRALKGEEPIDSTLQKVWDQRELQLREQLRRNLGPDYATSSAGQEALAEFSREKAQSFEQYNREVIGQFSNLTESRAIALSNLTGARLQQLLYPADDQARRGLLLGQVANDRNQFEQLQLQGRGQKLQASEAKANAALANRQLEMQAIQGIGQALGQIGQGAAGFATSDFAQSKGSIFDYLGSSGRQ